MSTIRVIAAATIGLVLVGGSSTLHTQPSTSTSTTVSVVTAKPSTITQTVSPPTTPMNVAVGNWLDNVQDHLDAIVNGAGNVGAAADSGDISGVGAACKQFHDGVQGLQGHMPTPDPQLTTALQAALSDYYAGLHFCMAGAEDYDINEVSHAKTFIQSANGYMENATSILNRDLGRTDVHLG